MSQNALVDDGRVNTVLGWASVVVVAVVAVERLLVNASLWAGFALLIVIVTALPALVTGDAAEMVPWPLPFVAAVAVVLRAMGLSPDVTGYAALSSLALIAVVELDCYTDIELSRRFGVVFATMTAMALQALWIIVQFFSDRWLGTRFLRTQTELQLDIVSVTVVSVVLGVLAGWYFARFDPVRSFDGTRSG